MKGGFTKKSKAKITPLDDPFEKFMLEKLKSKKDRLDFAKRAAMIETFAVDLKIKTPWKKWAPQTEMLKYIKDKQK